jgi:uncharacterized membrane protein
MSSPAPASLAAISFEYLSLAQAALLFALLATPIVLLGIRSLAGLGPVRRWVALGVRLVVLLLLVLILAGVRFDRRNEDVEVLVLRDTSRSAQLVKLPAGTTLEQQVNRYLEAASDDERGKRPSDRIGVIGFADEPFLEALPNETLQLDARAIRGDGDGTNVASAIQLALATLKRDAMHRLVLVWDGNATAGDLDAALAAAASARVPIDVLPVEYDVQNEVLVDRFIAPAWKRENEPFTIEVILRSTNLGDVSGLLTVFHQDLPMDLDPEAAGVQSTRRVTLRPGRNVERVRVPALSSAGVHQFRAVFEAPNVAVEGATPAGGVAAGGAGTGGIDTLPGNNGATAFTFVRGKGQVLYLDNVAAGRGSLLRAALAREGLTVDPARSTVDQFPPTLVELQNYDAVILANVPRGSGGLSEQQQKMLANYVHDLGGGLVMIGGPDAFGAGGWRGSELEQVLPVDMDVPAQRQIAKGALVLIMHSTEMPQGNYWGEQCAIKAVETLSARDEVGVISYGWRGGAGGNAGGGSQWDYPLSDKGDGSRVLGAIKQMQLGDMPDFDDSLRLALFNSRQGPPAPGSLIASNARQKHIIIISDGDPQPPSSDLIQACRDNKITISTITVYPHMGDADGLPRVMKDLAEQTGGRAYGPIDQNPNQLPQIFIKEAAIVRRSLIQEDDAGIPVSPPRSASEAVKGFASFPAVYGMVLTTKKPSPQVDMPLTAGKNNDPLLAHWQAGLGRSLVFTADAHDQWAANWISGGGFGTFWAQAVRVVARPAESSDFDVQVTAEGGRGRIVVEALDRDNAFRNFLTMDGAVVGPDGSQQNVRLVQIAPGTYAADFAARQDGNYVVGLVWTGANGQSGQMRSGTVVNASPELRELQSNRAAIQRVADATGGRVLPAFDASAANLFTRDGLPVSSAPRPWWDRLIPWLLAAILVDVAVRRIAWSWTGTLAMAERTRQYVRAWTLSGKVESEATLEALRRKRGEVAETRLKQPAATAATTSDDATRTRKFEATGPAVRGEIGDVVGGATAKPIPPPPKDPKPKGLQPEKTDTTGSLLEAKRRARKQMEEEK